MSLAFVIMVMGKFFSVLVQSNLYFQIGFCAFNRFCNIILRKSLLLLAMLMVLFWQDPFQILKQWPLKVCQILYLWVIGNLAKPSVDLPSCGSLRTQLGVSFFFTIALLLKSLGDHSLLGLAASFFMVILLFFLMNGVYSGSYKKRMVKAFIHVMLFVRHEPFAFVICLLLCVGAWGLSFLFFPLSFCFVGLALVIMQLFIVKSLCMNNDIYYYQGF